MLCPCHLNITAVSPDVYTLIFYSVGIFRQHPNDAATCTSVFPKLNGPKFSAYAPPPLRAAVKSVSMVSSKVTDIHRL